MKINDLLLLLWFSFAASGHVFGEENIPGLLEKATKQGQVSVIVSLKLPPPGFIPEGKLTGDEVVGQRALIANTKRDLLKSLSGNQIIVYATWESLPSMALKVDAATLEQLANSPYVTTIQEDTPERTQNTGTGRGVDADETP